MGAILPLAFLVMLAIKVPIAFALGLTGLFALFLGGYNPIFVARQIFSGVNSFALMAIPFFILGGQLMNEGRITEKLVAFADALVGRLKGGLGHINVIASILFAGISGAAASDVAALGSMLIPAMVKKGYSRAYAAAITVASSIIGPTIPPSIPMIIYGAIMNVSIAGLFAAGIVPGVSMGLMMMLINRIISGRRGYETSSEDVGKPSLGTRFDIFSKSIKHGFLALIMPVIIIGGILGGVFTPTEAAAVATVYALFVGVFIFRTLKPRIIWKCIQDAVAMTGMAMFIVATGRIISWYLSIERVPDAVARIILDITTTDWIFLLITAIFLLMVGMFMDLTASIIILAPILTPVAMHLGIDPFRFGITFILSLNIGLGTPPVGAMLFIASSVAKEKIENIVVEILPFYLAQLATLILVIFIPEITKFVPRILGLS